MNEYLTEKFSKLLSECENTLREWKVQHQKCHYSCRWTIKDLIVCQMTK